MMCFYLRSMWTSVALLFLLVLLLHFPLSFISFPVSLLSPFVDSSSNTDREYLSQRGLCSLIMRTKQFLHLYLPPTVPYLFFDTDYLGVMNTQKQMHMISFGCLTLTSDPLPQKQHYQAHLEIIFSSVDSRFFKYLSNLI